MIPKDRARPGTRKSYFYWNLLICRCLLTQIRSSTGNAEPYKSRHGQPGPCKSHLGLAVDSRCRTDPVMDSLYRIDAAVDGRDCMDPAVVGVDVLFFSPESIDDPALLIIYLLRKIHVAAIMI